MTDKLTDEERRAKLNAFSDGWTTETVWLAAKAFYAAMAASPPIPQCVSAPERPCGTILALCGEYGQVCRRCPRRAAARGSVTHEPSGCTPCSDCGCDYVAEMGAWRVPDDLWLLVETDPTVVLCQRCFVKRLEGGSVSLPNEDGRAEAAFGEWVASVRAIEAEDGAAAFAAGWAARGSASNFETAFAELDEVGKERRLRDLAEMQLAAVDQALGPWESAPGESCVGRVQTILNLKARAALVAAPSRPEGNEAAHTSSHATGGNVPDRDHWFKMGRDYKRWLEETEAELTDRERKLEEADLRNQLLLNDVKRKDEELEEAWDRVDRLLLAASDPALPTTEDAVERVAKALWLAGRDASSREWDWAASRRYWENDARTAITALRAEALTDAT